MEHDFYCDEVLSGKTVVEKVRETPTVLAFQHTRPAYPVHIVVIPKQHIASLLAITAENEPLLLELLGVVQDCAAHVVAENGACRIVTNLGTYQESKHLHWHIISGERLQTVG
ncbi:MAG: HIT domain-containing protein [Chloroflexota bacterium]|nr:HIT domain-containing protein [Chloroflexota bacterium]